MRELKTLQPMPHGHVKLSTGEVVDLTANRVAHGLLDEEVQAAMVAHDGPYDIYTQAGWKPWQSYTVNGKSSGFYASSVIRVRPAPKVETVTRHIRNGVDSIGSIAIDLIDRVPDWSTLRKWEGDL